MSKTIIPHPADLLGKTGDTIARHERDDPPSRHNQIESLTSQGPIGLDYFLFIPDRPDAPEDVMVSVHGLARNAAENMFRFARLAEEHNACLIVPHFSRDTHRRYQTLAPGKQGAPADAALNEVLKDVDERFGIDTHKFAMFGFSGGGQFAHRYMLCNPGRVERAVLMAPGWFTMPDSSAPFPYGLAESENLGEHQIDLGHLLETPILVMVGAADTRRNNSLNKDHQIDAVQGRTRLDRAKNWVRAMNLSALSQGLPENVSLHIIQGAGHNFTRNMSKHKLGELTMDFLLPNKAKGPE